MQLHRATWIILHSPAFFLLLFLLSHGKSDLVLVVIIISRRNLLHVHIVRDSYRWGEDLEFLSKILRCRGQRHDGVQTCLTLAGLTRRRPALGFVLVR
jgi:hypothetical protein